VATLSVAAPALGRFAAAPFVLVAVAAALTAADGVPVEPPGTRDRDRLDRTLHGLTGFALAATVLALFTTSAFPHAMPAPVFAAAVCVPAYGALGRQLAERSTRQELLLTTGYVAAGGAAGLAAQAVVAWQLGDPIGTQPAFLAASGALFAAAVHAEQYVRDDPPVLITIGFLLWVLGSVSSDVRPARLAGAIAVVGALAYVSYRLRTATVSGMLTGAFVALLAIVLGGIPWFVALVAFFGVGGFSTQFRYDLKLARGVAEGDGGARGGFNVVCNAGVAVVAIVGFAGAALVASAVPVSGTAVETVARLCFLGSIATALGDTLASEIGGAFDRPRLLTTLERVDPGTDGAVTWQGELAGLTGAGIVGAIGALLFPGGVPLAAAVVGGGLIGTTADSLLGATVEGRRLGNGSVNFLATAAGGTAAALVGAVAAPLGPL
jgi:uncharacterized protein (TIGR00297 family)